MMRKKIAALMCATAMFLSMPGTAYAEVSTVTGSVEFTAENKLDSNGTADLNAAVGAMQPGDEIIISIQVANTSGQAANYYMTNEVMSSLEDTEGTNASGGAYEYVLTYTDSAGSTTDLFRSTALGGTGATVDDRVGLKGATSGLEEYIFLETLESGWTGTVTLQVGLDGETQGNSYQGTAANLQMNFAVDTDTTVTRDVTDTVNRVETVEVVDDTNSGTDESGNGSGGRRNGNVVRTSDESNMIPFVAAAGISGLLLLILAVISMKERKKLKKNGAALGLCLAMCLAGLVPADVQAAPYTYTVRLYMGVQGFADSADVVSVPAGATVEIRDNGSCVEISGLTYKDRIDFNALVHEGTAETVSLKADETTGTSKYYVTGVRESGAEINVATIEVTEDKDYVVSYGIRGNMTYYTVNYVDQAGNTLFPSQRYSGKAGDFAVVAYRYVEGFQPYAYNLGKTLTENEAENVFNFVYTPLPEIVNTTTETVTITETVTVPGPEPEAPPVETAPPVVEPGQEPVPAPEEEVEIPDEPIPQAEPQEFVNLDDNRTPTAQNPGNGNSGSGDGESGSRENVSMEDFATPLAALPTAAKVGISVGVVVFTAVIIAFLAIRFRKKEKAKHEAE